MLHAVHVESVQVIQLGRAVQSVEEVESAWMREIQMPLMQFSHSSPLGQAAKEIESEMHSPFWLRVNPLEQFISPKSRLAEAENISETNTK